ncbi:PrgI family protein, partial [Candidatus Curtissbacteria bacterium]|nr:PrgI family protein [Candidatus Curtissbacteria bacterium]
MDQQHPIPQHISSYQFRLVGDMTLKQFFQLAAGLLTSLAFYASPLHPLIKWPFILFFALLGVALAFLPFEERPLSTWIAAFFKSVYSPTLFSWQKSKTSVKFFQDEAPPPAGGPSEKIITPKGEKAASEYLSGLSAQRTAFLTTLEEAEGNFLSRLGQIFGKEAQPTTQPIAESPVQETAPTPIPQTPPPPPATRPKIIVEERPVEVKLQGVAPTLVGQKITGREATFSLAAAPPNPPTIPNTVVGQIFDAEGKIIEGAILEIRDVSGLPVRALRSNKVGHFMIVT